MNNLESKDMDSKDMDSKDMDSKDMDSKDTTVIVERVANGYQVRPISGIGDAVCVRDILVFQDKGFVIPARDYQATEATLLGWLDQHFTEAKQTA